MNLERLINTPYVRERLGIDKKDGDAVTLYPDKEILKGLTKVVEDLSTRKKTVSDIKRQAQRIDYINDDFPPEFLPDPSTKKEDYQPIGQSPEVDKKPPKNKKKTQSRSRRLSNRKTLIPHDCKLYIEPDRINRIYRELKRLKIDDGDFPNAGGILLRVFIELSTDHFLEDKPTWTEKKIASSFLSHKLAAIAKHFEENGVMTKEELAPIVNAKLGHSVLGATVKSFHQLVHSRHFKPVPSELKTTWDNFQPFIEHLWPGK